MANYPQLDDCSGVWTLKEVNDAVMGGYWRSASAIAIVGSGNDPSNSKFTQSFNLVTGGTASVFGDLVAGKQAAGSTGSFTRAIFFGGYDGSTPYSSSLEK